ncbi:MAG: triose-phosphate isomerase [Chloroflexota bacterium]
MKERQRVPVIAGNWKMNTTVSEAVALVRAMKEPLDSIAGVDKVVCPPFVSLAAVKEVLGGTSVKVGAQNLYFEEKGAYTGEISPLMLAGLCEYVIIGHSERRQYFHEAGELIYKKVFAAIKFGLKPILCVGERLEDNEAGRTEAVITEQLRSALGKIDFPQGLVVAYEPVWAIGTGKAAIGAQANQTAGVIRHILSELYGDEIANDIRILYGGSVTPANIAEFIKEPEIDGGLVGGASLKADQFLSIVQQTAELKGRAK